MIHCRFDIFVIIIKRCHQCAQSSRFSKTRHSASFKVENMELNSHTLVLFLLHCLMHHDISDGKRRKICLCRLVKFCVDAVGVLTIAIIPCVSYSFNSNVSTPIVFCGTDNRLQFRTSKVYLVTLDVCFGQIMHSFV